MKSIIACTYRCRISYIAFDQAILDRLRSLGPIFRSGQAVGAGVSWRDLYRMRDAGLIVEQSRGVYQVGDEAGLDQVDFVVACARAPRAMVCLGSALAYWELSDEIPRWIDLAVPTGAPRPHIDHPPTRVHVFAAATFALGRAEVAVGSGAHFAISDPERTVVDAFRMRHRIGDDLAVSGLRRYLRCPQAKPGLVLELADALRVRTPVGQALRVLQA